MENQYLQTKFMDYNSTFKSIKKHINVKLESQSTIFPTKLDYPIIFYLIENIKLERFLKILKTKEDIDLYKLFFSNYKSFTKTEFCKFMDIYGYELINYINYDNKTMNIINDLSGYTADERQLYTKFISCELQIEFESKRYIKKKFIVSYNDIRFTLIIYYKSKPSESKLKQLCSLVVFMKIHYGKDINVDVTLFFIDIAKRISNGKKKILGPNNVNSGYSEIMSNNSSNVCVFRIEEMEKVLVHEMVHALKLDKGHISVPDTFFNIFNISPKTEILLNEAYTEILALILLLVLKSKKYNELLKNIEKEQKHTAKQVAKILKYYNFNTIEEFIRPYDNLDRYKQNTSIFSYYFVKGGLLNSFTTNIELFGVDNKGSINAELMIDFSLREDYLELIDEQMKKKDSSKSMKMTVIG
jgi:hypothetical protein